MVGIQNTPLGQQPMVRAYYPGVGKGHYCFEHTAAERLRAMPPLDLVPKEPAPMHGTASMAAAAGGAGGALMGGNAGIPKGNGSADLEDGDLPAYEQTP